MYYHQRHRDHHRLVAIALLLTIAIPKISMTADATESPRPPRGEISHSPFGALPDGTAIERYTLSNRRGMQAQIITYGGIVTELTARDRRGHHEDVVLGFDQLDGYLQGSPYFGALIGRYGNRIANGRFGLEGREYHLATNNGPNSLHGGLKGFDKVVWRVKWAGVGPRGAELTLHYVSRDGEEGYPGSLEVTATYTLTEDDALRLDYTATTDQDTVVNLTQHSYFNLRGQGHGDILEHQVEIDADRFTPVDSTLIPTGELRSVTGTPFDFRTLTPIGSRIESNDEQLRFGHGYDHNWVIRGARAAGGAVGRLTLDATVYEPESGRVLEVRSDQPGLQFYTGNFLDGTIHGKGGKVYPYRGALCLETQHFPDSPNKPSFPSTELKPGQTYHTVTVYRFSAR